MKKLLLLSLLLVVVAATILFLPYKTHFLSSLPNLQETLPSLSHIPPFYIILAIALLPAFGFPISPLYIFSAAIYGTLPALLYVSIGVFINLSLTFWLASSILRKPITSLLHRFNFKLLDLPPQKHTQFIIATRIMPAIPFVIQNYLLGITGITYRKYIAVSFPLQMLIAGLFILTSGALFESQSGLAIMGVCTIIAFFLFIRIFRNSYNYSH